jgi:hypothetical protein
MHANSTFNINVAATGHCTPPPTRFTVIRRNHGLKLVQLQKLTLVVHDKFDYPAVTTYARKLACLISEMGPPVQNSENMLPEFRNKPYYL